MKTYRTNFVPPLIEPILFLVALGFGLGLFIETIENVSYAEFIAPALIAISIMSSASFECTYGSYVRMHYQKTFDAIIATPISVEEVIAGELLWGATKSLINSSIVLAVVTIIGLTDLCMTVLILPLTFVCGLLFAGVAMCFTAIVPNIDSFNYFFFLLWTPMFLFCGTFFPLNVLPLWVQHFAFFLPLTHVVNIMRDLALNTCNLDTLISFGWICAVSVILFVLAINLMKKRLIK
jgi:lipooligosaccharide transport system permease protein